MGDEETFRILIATDLHIGFAERDPIRGADTFNTFEEIMRQAKNYAVDFVLFGGDIFHHNKPSRRCLYRVMEILKKYCLGDDPIRFQVLSDQSLNFTSNGRVNYEDPNYNIALPVFSIHGNHDDPGGEGGLSSLDLLSVSNLINYFGKSEKVDDVTIHPILLQKGSSKLALYGLGNIRDERLYRTFQQRKVKMLRPMKDKDSWFNLFILHQNRVAHSEKNYIHEVMLDNFLDLVIWGHEHECRIIPQQSSVGEFYISQPGSPVATSLCAGEAAKKHVGLLEIKGDQWRIRPIPLKTVRPFVMGEINLAEANVDITSGEAVISCLAKKVEEMIKEAIKEQSKKASFPERPANAPNLNELTSIESLPVPREPLIRLRVQYPPHTVTCNPTRFGQAFVGRVANPNDILLYQRQRESKKAREGKTGVDVPEVRPQEAHISVGDILISHLDKTDQEVSIFTEEDLEEALKDFVDKDDNEAITSRIYTVLNSCQEFLNSHKDLELMDAEGLAKLVKNKTLQARKAFKEKRQQNKLYVEEEEQIQPQMEPEDDAIPQVPVTTKRRKPDTNIIEEDVIGPKQKNPRKKKQSSSTTKKRKVIPESIIIDDDDDDEDPDFETLLQVSSNNKNPASSKRKRRESLAEGNEKDEAVEGRKKWGAKKK